MLKQLYSIRDNKISSYVSIFEAKNNDDATRMLQTAMRDDKIQLSLYPEDFDLYHIGSMLDESGKIIQEVDQPKFVVGAISFRKLQNLEAK